MTRLKYIVNSCDVSGAGPVLRYVIRYLPFVLMILFMKFFVIFLLMDTLANNSDNFPTVEDYGTAVHSSNLVKQNQSLPIIAGDSVLEEKLRVLLHLNDTVLVPSSRNRTPHDTVWLFFNRIPRTGGQTLVSLLQDLSEELGNQHQEHEYRTPWQRLLANEEQNNLANWFQYNIWPTSYDRFALHVNFTKHRSKYVFTTPAYITLLRNPVDQFISNFHHKRTDREGAKMEMSVREREKPGLGRQWYWRTIDECVLQNDPECALEKDEPSFLSPIPFLCGQDEQCLKRGDKWALQKGKYNAEYEYSVVGIAEQWNSTLTVLEYYLPLFFHGASQRYWRKEFEGKMENQNTKSYDPPSQKATQILKKKLALEMELYEYATQRLHLQYIAISDLVKGELKLPKRTPPPKLLSPLDRFEIELYQRGRK